MKSTASLSRSSAAAPVRRLDVRTYRVPTESANESDGTLVWDATTLVLVELEAGGCTGLGYTYADTATATLIRDTLHDVVVGANAFEQGAIWSSMIAKIRNLGREGITAMAISAIDIALWDLRGKLLDAPVAALLGTARERVPRLRQRRVHVVRHHHAHFATWGLGRFRNTARQDEDRSRADGRCAPNRRSTASDRNR